MCIRDSPHPDRRRGPGVRADGHRGPARAGRRDKGRVNMEQDAFDVLEQKVRKAADTVKRLRGENEGLEKERGKLRTHVQELEKRVASLEKESEKKGAGAEQVEALTE